MPPAAYPDERPRPTHGAAPTQHSQHSPRTRPTGPIARVVAVAAVVGLLLTGCGAERGETNTAAAVEPMGSSEEKPTVLTTFTVLADITRNVAGEHASVESITAPGAEIHGYEPTPGDVRKASEADLILDNGLNLEAWFEKFVRDAKAPHAVVSEGVDVLDITEDAHAGKPNPHAWMSPLNVQKYAENIATALAQLDPQHEREYRDNARAYQQQLQGVHNELTRGLADLPEKHRALVTCEGAFSYLARDAGVRERYIWPVNAEQQATPQQIAATIDYVREHEVPAVFCESTVSDDPMQQVVRASGARFGGTLYVDSLSEADGAVPTYLDLIRHDTRVIVDGLTGGDS